ncbi:hypothetical protein CLAIMM_03549 [Cladophialophora immunda]|nr:hypothetical protein CLAIMM_03549 [Cladophialophora immunda]
MSTPTPSNDPSKSDLSTPKKETAEQPPSPTSGADATTPTASAAHAPTPATDPDATPKKAQSYRVDPSSTPSAKHGSIAAWGSTSGKLYLSSPRLNDRNR